MASGLIGVDGGGSGCRFALLRDGQRFELQRGPANASTDLEATISVLQDGLTELAQQAGLLPHELAACPTLIALAGVKDDTTARLVAEALPISQVHVCEDTHAAVAGALGGGEGFVVAAGTGSFIARRQGLQTRSLGGHGLILGDEASGAWLGRGALSAALKAGEALGPGSDLTAALTRRFEGATGIIAFAAEATPPDFAALAPQLIAAAKAGEAPARSLMQDGADYIVRGLKVLGHRPGSPVCLTGGVGPAYAPYLPDALQTDLAAPKGSPLDGALRLAAGIAP